MLVSTVYAAPESFGRLQVLTAACAFSVHIYCDFSAYSDMALGCADIMGFKLMENFKTPYFARTTADFWWRWHISLTSWFRDSPYIPLGGSRKGKPENTSTCSSSSPSAACGTGRPCPLWSGAFERPLSGGERPHRPFRQNTQSQEVYQENLAYLSQMLALCADPNATAWAATAQHWRET